MHAEMLGTRLTHRSLGSLQALALSSKSVYSMISAAFWRMVTGSMIQTGHAQSEVTSMPMYCMCMGEGWTEEGGKSMH